MLGIISAGSTREDLRAMADDGATTGVRFFDPPSAHQLAAANEEIFARRPEIRLVFTNYGRRYLDLAILPELPAVRRIGLSLMGPIPPEVSLLLAVPGLESLSLNMDELPDSLLSGLPQTLQSLSLGETQRKKGSLTSVRRLGKLRHFSLTGHARDIEVVGELVGLEKLNLQSTNLRSLKTLASLRNLVELRIALGGLDSLAGIAAFERLEYLELWQVRGLRHVEEIAELGALKRLFLQSLRNVTSLPSLARLGRLTEIHLDTMKGLRDFAGVAEAPALESFAFIAATNCEPGDFEPLLRHEVLRVLTVGFGSRKKNDAFDAQVIAAGKRPR